MASQSIVFVGIQLLLFSLINPALCCYKAIFNFGDSLSDTGNNCYGPVAEFPYGITYFHKPTGRYCDGRIILDFIATAFGLPMVPPYLPLAGVDDAEVFRYGANFAVGGVTALDKSFFAEKGIKVWSEYPLSVQVREFKQLLPRLCNGSDSSDILSKSLVMLGEIGGNDYFSLLPHIPLDEVKAAVPIVICAISSAIDTMIGLGATVIVVPGVTPFGCVSSLLATYRSSRDEDYDEIGCLKWLNELAGYHNDRLQDELVQIRKCNPRTKIIYADYYNSLMNIYENSQELGFEEPLAPCFFGGALCNDPSVYVCWDGIHYTEAAYNIMAHGLLEGHYDNPPLSQTCTLISSY